MAFLVGCSCGLFFFSALLDGVRLLLLLFHTRFVWKLVVIKFLCWFVFVFVASL